MTTTRAVLVEAKATEVLGEYDHAISIAPGQDFKIIYGPNGVGKTKFLEIIHAHSRLDGKALMSLPFRSASLEYSDGKVLRVVAGTNDRKESDVEPKNGIVFELKLPEKELKRWPFDGDDFDRWMIANTTWRPIPDSDMWEDRRDGELIPRSEVEMLFQKAPRGNENIPEQFQAHLHDAPTFLIETQRLRIKNQPNPRSAWRSTGRRQKSPSRIAEQAEIMQRLVNEAQTEHSRITQQLDRTFPNRILGRSDERVESDVGVRNRYNEQNAFRSRLGRVASVTLEDALSLPDRSLLPWELGLLHLYLDDAEKKLAPFAKLLSKVELLEQIVNSRLYNKHIQVTAGSGLVVRHDQGGRAIELDSLSSGEQHEVILMFDLLFNVPEGALVLIDEPEISLHVVWQMAFVPDVQRIAELSGFRFIVATHSPQIINDRWSDAVRLGPSGVSFS